MLVYAIIEYLWQPAWLWPLAYLWKNGVWSRTKPPYPALGYRHGWYCEKPPFKELACRYGWYAEMPPCRPLAQRVRKQWISTSSPNALTVKQGEGVSCGKQVIEVDTNGEEYEKVTHARNVKQFGSISDFMVIRNIRTGEVLHLNVKYAGFGVSVNKGKFVLRQKRERG